MHRSVLDYFYSPDRLHGLLDCLLDFFTLISFLLLSK